MRVGVVADAPDHERWEIIHQTGCFCLDAETAIAKPLQDLRPLRSILNNRVPSGDSPVVDHWLEILSRFSLHLAGRIAPHAALSRHMRIIISEQAVMLCALV